MQESAVLLINCPDRKGLVARVSRLLYDHGANILHADQHQDHDLGLFFMRVEWALNGGSAQSSAAFDLAGFRNAFSPIAKELDMRWKLSASAEPPRVALFCSQYMHCMVDLLHRWHSSELQCEISVIVSNHRAVEKLADFYGVPFAHIPVTAANRNDAEKQQIELLEHYKVELVVLARYMQILRLCSSHDTPPRSSTYITRFCLRSLVQSRTMPLTREA